jgi:hypothetical protein
MNNSSCSKLVTAQFVQQFLSKRCLPPQPFVRQSGCCPER